MHGEDMVEKRACMAAAWQMTTAKSRGARTAGQRMITQVQAGIQPSLAPVLLTRPAVSNLMRHHIGQGAVPGQQGGRDKAAGRGAASGAAVRHTWHRRRACERTS